MKAPLAVGPPPARTELHGVTVTILEVETGGGVPAVVVNLETAAGDVAQRRVAAGKPASGAPAAGEPTAFAHMDLIYDFVREVVVETGPDGASAAANCALRFTDRDGTRQLAPGARFHIATGDRIEALDESFTATIEDVLVSAVKKAVVTEDPDAEPAVQVSVTADDGARTTSRLSKRSVPDAKVAVRSPDAPPGR